MPVHMAGALRTHSSRLACVCIYLRVVFYVVLVHIVCAVFPSLLVVCLSGFSIQLDRKGRFSYAFTVPATAPNFLPP